MHPKHCKHIVNRAIHPIRCAASCKQKFQRGMYIGDLCAETGHFFWALKVWSFTARLIKNKDDDDWLYVRFILITISLARIMTAIIILINYTQSGKRRGKSTTQHKKLKISFVRPWVKMGRYAHKISSSTGMATVRTALLTKKSGKLMPLS